MEEEKHGGFSVLMSVWAQEDPDAFDIALGSNLVAQTKRPDELVLVCDGPLTLGLEAVIAKYKKAFPSVLKVFYKDSNQGLGNALRFGLAQCTCPLVARSDSDDVCAEERFEVQTAFMEQHPDISIISSYIDEFEQDWKRPRNIKICPLDHEKMKKMVKLRNPLNHMAVMFRKEDILEVGSYRHVPYTEDYDLWIRAVVQGKKIANIGRVLVHARVGPGWLARRSSKARIASWKQMNEYMYENHFITYLEKCRNMMGIRIFVYMPLCLKKLLYDTILRKKVTYRNGT